MFRKKFHYTYVLIDLVCDIALPKIQKLKIDFLKHNSEVKLVNNIQLLILHLKSRSKLREFSPLFAGSINIVFKCRATIILISNFGRLGKPELTLQINQSHPFISKVISAFLGWDLPSHANFWSSSISRQLL